MRVVNARVVRRNGPEAPSDAAGARALVAGLLGAGTAAAGRHVTGPHVSGAALADALLVTSELVTNAYRHGGGLVGFEAEVDREALELTVTDRSGEVPHVVPHPAVLSGGTSEAIAEGGFGWPLIRLLADRVSVAPLPKGGKSIQVRLLIR
ncbi:ATP-binding protein [Streptomyces sp. NBC_00536]|uniref:ATP-binding protein n=1 Tax=Streptomyces sp. NBC_00536 TaxID=2975769 RepID=UPI002E7FDAD8|nr:ATP-binding protein [Streptomyces sp. NBC_00536]WUC77359.1 ATP-binding protein [Streptomyces sp. NBC_00536]